MGFAFDVLRISAWRSWKCWSATRGAPLLYQIFPLYSKSWKTTNKAPALNRAGKQFWSRDCPAVCLQPWSIPEACVHQCIRNADNKAGSSAGKWWNFSHLGTFKWKLLCLWKIHSLKMKVTSSLHGPGQQLSYIFQVPCIPSCRSSGHPFVTSVSHPCPAWLPKHLVLHPAHKGSSPGEAHPAASLGHPNTSTKLDPAPQFELGPGQRSGEQRPALPQASP